MSRKCQLSSKKPLVGNHVSHANNKTKRRQLPNLQWKKIYIPELNKFVRLRLSTSMIRTIDKKGLDAYLRKSGLSLKNII